MIYPIIPNLEQPRQGVLHQRHLHAAHQRARLSPLRGVHRAGHVGRRTLRRLPLVPLQPGPPAQVTQGHLQVCQYIITQEFRFYYKKYPGIFHGILLAIWAHFTNRTDYGTNRTDNGTNRTDYGHNL